MSYYRQQNRPRLSIGQDGNSLTLLIAINLLVFVILAFIKVIYYFSQGDAGTAQFTEDIFKYVALPADLEVLLVRPWTIITHMFVHDTSGIWHILGNMLWLWMFGSILQDLSGNKRIFPVFLYGAFAGAVAYLLAYNTIAPLKEYNSIATAVGASAGVMGIAIATTTLAPGFRIFPMLNGGIPLWVITVIYLIMDLAFIPNGNAGGHIAHIAGAAMGFFYMRRLQAGYDIGNWMNNFFDWVGNLFNPDKPRKGRTIKSQLFYKARVQPYTKTPTVTQQRVDEILEKIHQKGFNSLSEDDKEVLKRATQEGL